MNRKRLWIWAVLACLLVGILAACDPTDPPSVEETSGITEVTSVSEEAPTDPETDPETLPVTESDTEPALDTGLESDTEPTPDTELESDTETEPDTGSADSETAEPPETDVIPCAHTSWGEKTEVVAPTCTAEGYYSHACTRCGFTETVTVDALGHTEVVDVGKEATCTQSGISVGKHCSVCGVITVEQTRIPAKGHTEAPVWGQDPTCTVPGLTDGKACSVCGVVTVTQTEIPATGHTEVVDRAVAATCTAAGKSEGKHCSVCGTVTVPQKEISAKGHKATVLPAVKATCTQGGLTEGAQCSVCGVITVEQTVLPAKGHSEVLDAARAPTCTKTGLTQGSHCAVCGQVAVAQTILPAKGHTETVVVGKPATCTQNGVTDGKKCSACGEILIAQTVLLSPGHKAVTDPGYEATCAATGLTDGSHCEVCEVILVAQEKILSPYHVFEDGKCVDCGCDRFSQGIAYTLNSDQKGYTVSGMGACTDTELIIPATYQDLPVTAIKASAFADCGVVSVVVPDSVTSIGNGAFQGCNNLVEITLPFIGRAIGVTGSEGVFGHIFGYVTGYSAETKTSQGTGYTYQGYLSGNYYNYYIPGTLRKVTVTLDTTIPEGAFRNCDLIEEIMLPDGIESIGSYTFFNCTALKTVDAGVDAIQTIRSYAFTNCVSLIRIGDVEKVIELPETLQNLGSYAFQNCVNFEVLRLDLVGGIYDYAFDGCTNVKEVTFGDQITSIGSNAFRNCPVTELIIPDGVTSIGGGAFQNWLITEVVVPDSVTSIGSGAFQGCNNLEEITLPFIGRAMGATGYEGVFGYIFGYATGYSAETKTSQGTGYTYQGYLSGNYYNYYIPGTLRKVTVTLDTTIPEGAFRNCDLIEEISLPDVSEQIDSYAFYNCTSLKTLQIRDSAPTPMLKKASASFFVAGTNAGGTLRRIGDYAFYNCSAMPSFDEDISGLTYLGQYAFYNCTSLTRVGKTAKVIALPETLTNVGHYAFYNCGQFETLILNLKGSIGDGAFDQCTSVASVTLGQDVTYIGNYAFRLCQAADLSLPMGLTHIGSEAFKGWLMNRVTVPDSVIYIGYGAFSGCGNIEQMTIPFVGDQDNGNHPFGYIFGSVSASGSALTSQGLGYTSQGQHYEIPQVLRRVTVTRGTKISDYAFYNCDLLEVIALPGTVQSIGSYALANCFDLTHLYFGGSQSDWRDISFRSSWKSGSDYYYLHMYADEYGVYIPTGAIHLQVASDNSFILLPLDGTVEAMAYRVRTHEIVPLDVANMRLEIVRNNCQLSITGGDTVDTPNGGVATLRVMRKMGQYDVTMNGDLGVFVAECARYKAASVPTFSLEEKQYIVFCVDFVMSMNDTSDPYTEIDFEFKYHEQLLYNASHITQYISGLLQGDARNTTVCKQILAKFIQSYVDADYAHMKAVSATETFMAGFESANELVKKYKTFNKFKKAFNVTQEGWEALVELKELHELYLLRGITVDELTKVGNLLSQLEKYGGMDDAFRSAQRWRDYTEKTRKTFDSLIDAANRLDKALGIELITDYNQKGPDLIEVLAGGGTITHFKDIQPGWDDAVNIGLEAIIYMLHDYSYNIEVLESIKTGFKKNGLEDSLGYTAVEEMIWEYNHKEISCAQDIIMRFGAITIVKIAKKNPVVSLVLFGADILKALNPVNEKKVEFLILDTYRTPLARCTWPAKDLYHNGVITMDLEELKTLTCIYLHLMKEYNELAIYITTRESTDEEYIEDAYALNHNISKIESLLQTYY